MTVGAMPVNGHRTWSYERMIGGLRGVSQSIYDCIGNRRLSREAHVTGG